VHLTDRSEQTNPVDVARPFDYRKRYPVLKLLELPEDPMAIPPGTDQQKVFDTLSQSR